MWSIPWRAIELVEEFPRETCTETLHFKLTRHNITNTHTQGTMQLVCTQLGTRPLAREHTLHTDSYSILKHTVMLLKCIAHNFIRNSAALATASVCCSATYLIIIISPGRSRASRAHTIHVVGQQSIDWSNVVVVGRSSHDFYVARVYS